MKQRLVSSILFYFINFWYRQSG